MIPIDLNLNTLRMSTYLRRISYKDQLEIDASLIQLWSLCTSPSIILKMIQTRKAIKNQYHRDSLTFFILLIIYLTILTISFGLTFRASLNTVLIAIITQLVLYCILPTVLIATILYYTVNRFMHSYSYVPVHEIRKNIDWQYCLDIHCNAYIPYFFTTQIILFICLPLITKQSFIAIAISNGIYGIGITQYFYIIFRSLADLSFLNHQQIVLYPLYVILPLILVASGWVNIVRYSLELFWHCRLA